jgi:hypothetical protein
MTEKYDFELMEIMENTKAMHLIVEKGKSLIYVSRMTEGGAFYNEYPPAPEFYFIQKTFYTNGMMEAKGKFIGQYLKIGIWEYYDEKGKLIKEEDEDVKFGKVKIGQILKFIEKEGWIDLATGKGREEIAYVYQDIRDIKDGIFTLSFLKKGEDPTQYNDYPVWLITIKACPETNFYRTIYNIHGETGEVLKKETKQILRTE